eukprot:CAMPEP_0114116474 /NCGR_PEP_ID=MMETSP0043_2-20121206/4517_1 /TAXON_ID=464988 /ORGANISM="Hemiselmis andersenii, Strain CCMP644" /LENGTH=169 /DNA_ID=CAMNT_0001208797 /DNA_START=277 /DNA_END=786 /DNA_ORIENTATION=+
MCGVGSLKLPAALMGLVSPGVRSPGGPLGSPPPESALSSREIRVLSSLMGLNPNIFSFPFSLPPLRAGGAGCALCGLRPPGAFLCICSPTGAYETEVLPLLLLPGLPPVPLKIPSCGAPKGSCGTPDALTGGADIGRTPPREGSSPAIANGWTRRSPVPSPPQRIQGET